MKRNNIGKREGLSFVKHVIFPDGDFAVTRRESCVGGNERGGGAINRRCSPHQPQNGPPRGSKPPSSTLSLAMLNSRGLDERAPRGRPVLTNGSTADLCCYCLLARALRCCLAEPRGSSRQGLAELRGLARRHLWPCARCQSSAGDVEAGKGRKRDGIGECDSEVGEGQLSWDSRDQLPQ